MEQNVESLKNSERTEDGLRHVALISQVGITILFTVGLFTLLGLYLDRMLHTRAVFTLLFVLFGCFAGIWTSYQIILKALNDDSEKK